MNVLITRPEPQASQLKALLAQHQINAWLLPFFTIEKGSQWHQVAEKMMILHADDIVILVSKNAVDFAHKALQNQSKSWRGDVQYLAVGRQTAHYFSQITGLPCYYPFHQQQNRENSEGLLDLPIMSHLKGKKVLLLRGNAGRALLTENITRRGGKLMVLECYQRCKIADPLKNVKNNTALFGTSQISAEKIQILMATSGEILDNLYELLVNKDFTLWQHKPLIVVSRRLQKMAEAVGFRHVVESLGDNQSLTKTILKLASDIEV